MICAVLRSIAIGMREIFLRQITQISADEIEESWQSFPSFCRGTG